jgi:hypothetical protein
MKQLISIATVLGLAGGAAADTVRLDYAARGAGCPDGGRFRDEVAARVGTQPFDDAALSVVRVRIQPDGAGYAGTLETQGASPRAFRDGECAALAETIASTLATRLDTRVVSVATAANEPPPTSPAPTQPARLVDAAPLADSPAGFGDHWFSGGLAFSQIWRTTSASGFRGQLGYDRRLSALSLGARVGIAKHEDNFGSSTLPYFGVRAFGMIALGARAQLKVGGGAELWLNSVAETGINGEPVFLHALVEVGPRIPLSNTWAIDIPVELGVMPFFSPKVFTLQLGAQAVYSL